MRDPRVELLFRICAAAFRQRNFDPEGVANRYMGLGYSLKLLEFFYDDPTQRLPALVVGVEVGCAQAAQEDILKAYESYDFHEVVQRLMRFCSIEMGSFYLDIIKDRQYTAKADSVARRSCQTALFHIAEALVRWMAPIMSFTGTSDFANRPASRAAAARCCDRIA